MKEAIVVDFAYEGLDVNEWSDLIKH